MLYVIGTPIGNLADITYRAVQILSSVDIVVAEDSRRTKTLLDKFDITTKLVSIHEHSSDDKIDWLMSELKNGKHAALVTDAGTPGIADPGGRVVEKAIEAGVEVSPIPGPSSLSAILSITGWLNEPVLFLGYLPKKKGRQTLLKEITNPMPTGRQDKSQISNKLHTQNYKSDIHSKILHHKSKIYSTLVLFESPNRINKTIQELTQYLSEGCHVVIGRELTKQFEEIIRGTLGELSKRELKEKGEFVVAIKVN